MDCCHVREEERRDGMMGMMDRVLSWEECFFLKEEAGFEDEFEVI